MRENFTKGLLIKIMDSNFQEIKEKLNLEEIIIRETGIVRKRPLTWKRALVVEAMTVSL